MIDLIFGTGQNGSPVDINRGTVSGSSSVVSSVRRYTSAAEEKAIAWNAALVEKFASAGEM